MWYVRGWTRHHGEFRATKELYATEEAAIAAAKRETEKMNGCGVFFDAAQEWDAA